MVFKEITMTHADLANMPISEKIQLMESLWESLSNTANAPSAVPDWHSAILAERGALIDQNLEPVSAWSDAKQCIRNQIAKQ